MLTAPNWVSVQRRNRLAHKGETHMADTNQQTGTTGMQLALAWLFVGIPLTWGVIQTLINAMQLFH